MINFINNENVKKMIINTNTYIHIEIYENSASFFFSHRTEEDRREDQRRSMIMINRKKLSTYI